MNIVFTGVMNYTRDTETKKYEEFGITVQKNITKKTDVLIEGDAPGYGKLNKAERYGIKIMTEQVFFNMLKDEYPEFYL